jgi:predicted TIM-barrel fold metal-dependent hydrolase
MRSPAACFDELRAFCEDTPLIDCHDHTRKSGPKHVDPIAAVITGYFPSDVQSASSDADLKLILDVNRPIEERWPVLKKAWKRTRHTGYAQVTRLVLKEFYDEDDLTLGGLHRMKERLLNVEDEKTFDGILEKAKIAVRIEDVWPDIKQVLNRTLKLSPRGRLAISLPGYHSISRAENVHANMAPLGRVVTCLDEYIEGCREIFEACKTIGAVAFKDQSAYTRPIDYGNSTRAEAVFNHFMEDQRRAASYPDGVRPLDDFLFHTFMRMAHEMDLPVQIHTGHMAGIRNDIVKTNAAGLTSVLELHRETRFDLFHANWPYGGELIYLAKNFPNVAIDFCWANIIDPVYCQNMFKQVLSAVPHAKIHGYGSDFGGLPERAWAHARIARDNIAIALSEMVDVNYLDLDEAKEVARAWQFDNANAFFQLGC